MLTSLIFVAPSKQRSCRCPNLLLGAPVRPSFPANAVTSKDPGHDNYLSFMHPACATRINLIVIKMRKNP